MKNYYLVAHRLLRRLCKEFAVPIPELIMATPSERIAGCYYDRQIFIGKDTLQNRSGTLRTIRHEFGHYLEDYYELDWGHHWKARRFERNILEYGILPKAQKTMDNFLGE